jgi:hypothetical protein
LVILKVSSAKSLVTKKIDIQNFTIFQKNLNSLWNCPNYDFDEFDKQKPVLEFIILELIIQNDDGFTFGDLIKEYSKRKKTKAYQESRDFYFKNKMISETKVNLNHWERDKKVLLELNLTEDFCKNLKQFVQDTFANFEGQLDITYSQIFDAYERKCPPPSLSDILKLDKRGKLEGSNYDEILIKAKKEKKLLIVYFNGYGVINGRKMEENTLIGPYILDFIKKNYLLATLYVDDRTKLSEKKKKKYSRTY